MNFGEWEGLTFEEIKTRYSLESSRWMENWSHEAVPGGESFLEMSKRVIHEVEKIRNDHNGNVAIVSHGGCIRTILSNYIIGSLDDCWKFYIDQGTITRLSFNNNYTYLKSLNEY